jgi:chromosomal replication initiation ATPase DnaA
MNWRILPGITDKRKGNKRRHFETIDSSDENVYLFIILKAVIEFYSVTKKDIFNHKRRNANLIDARKSFRRFAYENTEYSSKKISSYINDGSHSSVLGAVKEEEIIFLRNYEKFENYIKEEYSSYFG